MISLAIKISRKKERKHERRLNNVNDNSVKRFLEQQTGRKIRALDIYKEEPLGNPLGNVPVPDLSVVYLADTFRLAFIEVKTSCSRICISNVREEQENLRLEIAKRRNIESYLKSKGYPQGVVDSIFKKGIEVYGARITANSGLVRIFDKF